MEVQEFRVSVVIYPEGDVWIAQCLEYDIVSQGETIQDVQDRLTQNIAATLSVYADNGKNSLEDIPPAPKKFWEMFERATVRVSGRKRPMRSPRPLPPIRPVMRLIEDWAA
ncbi:MAG: type II toxin-antitoxin system HicB family antitoxin [Stellaceae bacterium]